MSCADYGTRKKSKKTKDNLSLVYSLLIAYIQRGINKSTDYGEIIFYSTNNRQNGNSMHAIGTILNEQNYSSPYQRK